MKYDGWPVARLIEREISRPLLLTRYRPQVARPDKVTVLWSRDAWQYSARRPIKKADIAPTPVVLDRLDGQGWADALRGARECLDPRRQHRGRRKVPVTLLPSKRYPWERRVAEQSRAAGRVLGEVAFPNKTVANDSVGKLRITLCNVKMTFRSARAGLEPRALACLIEDFSLSGIHADPDHPSLFNGHQS